MPVEHPDTAQVERMAAEFGLGIDAADIATYQAVTHTGR